MTVEGQGSEAGNAAQVQGTNAEQKQQSQGAESVDVAGMQKQLETLLADNKRYRDRFKELSSVAEERAKKAGEFEPLLKERDEELAALRKRIEEIEPLASAETERRKAREQKIAETAKDLPDDVRRDLEAIADVDARERMLQRLTAPEKKTDPKAPPKEIALTKGQAPTGERQAFSIFPKAAGR